VHCSIDKPLLDDQGVRLVNFTRLMTFGDNQANGNNDVNWCVWTGWTWGSFLRETTPGATHNGSGLWETMQCNSH